MREPADYARILVIRLGALGDLILCSPAFQAIRAAHPRASITLLTQPNWVDFARSMPWFDQIITDPKPSAWQPAGWFDLWRRVRATEPQLVYDLQGKRRQTVLYGLLGGFWSGGDFAWSGAAWRCRYPRPWPPRPDWHFTDFIAAQLAVAGVTMPAVPDYAWLDAPVPALALPPDYAVLIPGCSPQHPHKRWPAESYAALAQSLLAEGLAVVLLGAKAEAAVLAAIKAAVPAVIDLCGQTNLHQIGAVARGARIVIGNDTGPTHSAAAVGAPTLTLFSAAGSPIWSCPQGRQTDFMQQPNLADLPVATVLTKARALRNLSI
jgi:ADP-heptose:LPS heptosyltransferase